MAHFWGCVGTIAFASGGADRWSSAVGALLEKVRGAGGFVAITVTEKEVTFLGRDWRNRTGDMLNGAIGQLCEAAAAHGGKGTVYAVLHDDDDGLLFTFKIKNGACHVSDKSQATEKMAKALERFAPADAAFTAWLETNPAIRARVVASGRFGYVDRKGSLAIEARFDHAWPFAEGRAPVRLRGEEGPIGPMHLVDASGALVTKVRYQSVDELHGGRALVTDYEDRSGYVDASGEVAIPLRFDRAHPFAGGVARVTIGSEERFVRRDGTDLVDRGFQWTSDFSDGVGLGWDGATWFAYDAEGTLLFETKAETIFQFHGGLAPLKRDGLWGFVDRTGSFAILPRFEEARMFSGERAIVKLGGELRFIDRAGNLVGGAFEWAHEQLVEGRMASYVFDEELRGGFISEDGVLVIPRRFESIRTFAEGLAAVCLEGRWGFVDRDGAFAIEPAFDDAGWFANGLAPVKKDHLWGFVDRSGALVVPPAYEEVLRFGDDLAPVRFP